MATFTGTNADETITPDFVSPTVTVTPPGGPDRPSDAVDTIIALGGDDTAAGGGGDDVAFMGSRNDVFVWAPGDGSDRVGGGAGTDTHKFFGSDGDEVMSISDDGPRVELLRDLGDIDMDLRNFERIELRAFGGNDSIDASGLTNPAALLLDGGAGDDTIIGSAGEDTIVARAGDDQVGGGRGDDLVFLGDADDEFSWAPGEGSDTADGGAGTDTHKFFGSDGDEVMSISDDGPRVELRRDLGDIDMDLRNFERIELRAFGGNDSIDASGLTNPVALLLDGGAGDDTIIGSAGADTFVVTAGLPTDGTPTLDVIEGYDQAQSDEIDLIGVTVASSAVVGSDLLLTLDSPDTDQVRLAGVTDITDVIFV